MRHSLRAVVVAGLITLATPADSGRSRDFRGPPPILHEITAVVVSVSAPDELTGVEKDVRDAVESALRRGGLAVDRGTGAGALPKYDVKIVAVADQGRYFYATLTQVAQGPDWSDPEAVQVRHVLWDRSPMIGIITPDQFDVLSSRAIHAAHQFLRSWEADKERAKDPDPDESDRLEYDLYADD